MCATVRRLVKSVLESGGHVRTQEYELRILYSYWALFIIAPMAGVIAVFKACFGWTWMLVPITLVGFWLLSLAGEHGLRKWRGLWIPPLI